MPDLIHLLTVESHKLMQATPPHVKHWLKGKVDKVLQGPELTEAAVIKAMKEVQRELDFSLKSNPQAKAAMIGLLVTYCVLLRHELREMAHLGHQPHTRQELLNHVNNVIRFSSLVQPLFKGSYSLQTEEIETIIEAMRRTH
jgi:hypothetical protein